MGYSSSQGCDRLIERSRAVKTQPKAKHGRGCMNDLNGVVGAIIVVALIIIISVVSARRRQSKAEVGEQQSDVS